MAGSEEQIVVHVDPDLKEFVSEFLGRRQEDVLALREARDRADWEAIRRLGHRLRGSGGGWGFDAITDIGRHLEDAARAGDGGAVHEWTNELARYLGCVIIA